ncbi:aldolase/citrate lyase family protein [Rhodococcus sp. O3]|uniref:aldolase/citrate lyase family protein n=1 Tax=Rhodococcus sp. O3 TaxID=3404919 RepID=UPI003B67A4F3
MNSHPAGLSHDAAPAPDARSWLLVPGTRAHALEDGGYGADAVVLDLEDDVAPAERARARDDIHDWAGRGGGHGSASTRLPPRIGVSISILRRGVRGFSGSYWRRPSRRSRWTRRWPGSAGV